VISTQVDSAAESMRQTEKAVSELQHLTGLADELQDPPAILDADLRPVLRRDA
jgi:SPX domain protein involved in polyphosphate accumulation